MDFCNTNKFEWVVECIEKKDMKLKITPIVIILFFLIIFIIFFKGLKNSNIYTPDLNLEKKIPILVYKSFENNTEIVSEKIFNKKRFYLMNIWASWCIPCREEHVFLMKLKKDQKVELIGLNYKDNITNAKKFLKELGNPYKKVFTDVDGISSISWGAYGVPESFLIYENKIIKRYIGPIKYENFIEIEKIIK